VPIALVGTVVLALLIMRIPLRRAASSPARRSAMHESALQLARIEFWESRHLRVQIGIGD